MGKKQTKIVPQFTVTIVINGEAIVAIDVCEDATLKDARKEILLESEDFSNLPKDYHFSCNGTPFSIRKERVQRLYLDRMIKQYVYGMLILVNVY